MQRITIRLTDEERNGVRWWSRERGVSENYVIRLAIRRLLRLPNDDPDSEHLSHVTTEGK